MPTNQTRVVVVDDSALMRRILTEMINSDPELIVVGAAADPFAARERIRASNPDVITLDVEMPRMDGLAFLEKIMSLRPTPVVMVSSLTEAGAATTVRALELGAIDYVAKPGVGVSAGMEDLRDELVDKIKVAARSRVRPYARVQGAPPRATASFEGSEAIVAIGASTGGVDALRHVICSLPANAPAVLVVQHMPERFTKSFAERLDTLAEVSVAEARDAARVLSGHVYLAPGNRHIQLALSGSDFVCRLDDGPLCSGHRPSADVLFDSVACAAGGRAVGVIMTGMGRDGAQGLKRMRDSGAMTLGQDEASCVVYGMPKAARELGAVAREASLHDLPEAILQACRERMRYRL